MRIALDIRVLEYGRVGIPVYVHNLLETLLQRDDGHSYVLIATQRQRLDLDTGDAEIVRDAPPFANPWKRDWWEQVRLAPLLGRLGCDVYHAPNYIVPLVRRAPCATVCTLYDASHFATPYAYHPLRNRRMQLLVRGAARRADRLLFGSRFTRDEFARHLGPGVAERGRVMYIALPRDWALSDDEPFDLPTTEPYALAIGSLQPRKNLSRLVRAFAEPPLRGRHLVIAGAPGRGAGALAPVADDLGIAARVHFTGRIATARLKHLARSAAVLVFPSLYEGFGIPVLEAFSVDLPVAASRISSLPEVGGDAAAYFDPESEADIAATVAGILDDRARADALREAGRRRLAEFSWDRCADVHLETFAEAAARGGRPRPPIIAAA